MAHVEVIRSRIETKEAGHALRASCAYRSGTRRPARLPCREAASFNAYLSDPRKTQLELPICWRLPVWNGSRRGTPPQGIRAGSRTPSM